MLEESHRILLLFASRINVGDEERGFMSTDNRGEATDVELLETCLDVTSRSRFMGVLTRVNRLIWDGGDAWNGAGSRRLDSYTSLVYLCLRKNEVGEVELWALGYGAKVAVVKATVYSDMNVSSTRPGISKAQSIPGARQKLTRQ